MFKDFSREVIAERDAAVAIVIAKDVIIGAAAIIVEGVATMATATEVTIIVAMAVAVEDAIAMATTAEVTTIVAMAVAVVDAIAITVVVVAIMEA